MDAAADLAAIIASSTGVSVGELDPARPVAHAGEQLAAVNLGFLSVARPEAFSWPGHWIAMVETATGERAPVAMFGVPSGPLDDAGAALLLEGTIAEALVVVPLDLDRAHGPGAYGEGVATGGTVTAIYTAPAAGADCVAHEVCRAYAGVGLEGDRYATGEGTFSTPGRNGQALTLVSEEAIAQAQLLYERTQSLPHDVLNLVGLAYSQGGAADDGHFQTGIGAIFAHSQDHPGLDATPTVA